MADESWKKYAADFDNLTDAQIEQWRRDSQEERDRAEDFLDALAAWEKAGRPRRRAVEQARRPRGEDR